MCQSVKWVINREARERNKKAPVDDFSLDVGENARKFHKSFDIYRETPLVPLKKLAEKLKVSGVFVKDESYRFGLKAFKVLGGSYAIGNLLAEKLGLSVEDITFDLLCSKETRDTLGEITFVTATDGNHGRGVAWAAQQLGQKSVVYMPKGSSHFRLNSIRDAGAQASITDMNYDGAVGLARDNAKKYGWEVVQDTAWEGYEDVPKWIMQGYITLVLEAMEQLKKNGIEKPTHIFLQAGVGSFAGAIQGFLTAMYGEDRPRTVIVEPNKADCMYQSIKNGKRTIVTGDMDTIMAGLACGEPNTQGWTLLKDYSDAFISCPEYIAANGMRILGNPLQGDEKVVSGESGAVTTGILYSIMMDKNLEGLKNQLQLNEESKVLVINTEGDTDPENYRKIVWEGFYPGK